MILIERLLTTVALLAAFRLMVPEFPVPGWVTVALTPLVKVPIERVILPVSANLKGSQFRHVEGSQVFRYCVSLN